MLPPMLRRAWLFALASCGRIGFDPTAIDVAGTATGISFGTSGAERVSRPDVDAEGNVYLSGNYHAPLMIGGELLPHTGTVNGYLASFDPAHGLRWAHGYGGDDLTEATRVVVAEDGTNFIAGLFSGSLVLPDGTHDSGAGQNIWVASHGRDGVFRWSRDYGGNWNFQPRSMSLSRDGSRVAVGGLYLSTTSTMFGPHTLGPSGVDNPFVLTLDAAGAEQSVVRMSALGPARNSALRYRDDGRMCRGGQFELTIDFEDDAMVDAVARGAEDAFVGIATADGTSVWATALGSPETDEINDVAAVGDDCVFVGKVDNAVELGGSEPGGLVVRYRRDSTRVWHRSLGGYSRAFAVTALPSGSVLVSGFFAGTWSPTGVAVTAVGDGDGYVAEIDTNGDVTRLWIVSGTGNDSVAGAVLAGDEIVITGTFSATLPIVGGTLEASTPGELDVFVLRVPYE